MCVPLVYILGPITPTFVLPHKRYATFDIADLSRKVVDLGSPLRQADSNADGRPIFYTSPKPAHGDLPALSHSTLSRWLTFFSAMVISLQVATDVFLQANPDSDVHRFEGNVDPSRSGSPERLEALSVARRLLHLQTRWDQHFLKSPFFARFGTRCRPP